MARKPVARTVKSSVVKNPDRTVRVKVARSFEYWVIGEEFGAPLSERVLALISGGYLEVTDHGESEAGPGATGTGDQGGEPEGVEATGPTGTEPGEDPSAR